MEDPQLSDDNVDQHGGPAPYGLIGGKVNDVVHEEHHGEDDGVRDNARCLAQDEVGGGFARGDKEEDVAVAIVVCPACTIFKGAVLEALVEEAA